MFRIFAPILKIDAVQRLVWGVITEEVVDKANEILDYETSKPLFEKWSAGIAKASGGKSMGNVRAMHQPIAAGKLVSIDFDDTAKRIECCAKIVDDAEWAKVEAGVYTGFSMGGSYVRRWDDPNLPTVKRFTADPVEVSIVDNPCVPTANFTMVKAGGVEEIVMFKLWTPSNDDVAAKAVELAGPDGDWAARLEDARAALIAEKSEQAVGKSEGGEDVDKAFPPAKDKGDADGDEDGEGESDDDGDEPKKADDPEVEKMDEEADDTDAAEMSAPAVAGKAADAADPWALTQRQVWVAADGKEFARKSDARTHNDALRAVEEGPLGAALAKARAALAADPEAPAVVAVDPVTPDLATAHKALVILAGDKVEKSLYSVGRLAELIDGLICVQSASLWDSAMDGDGPPAAVGELASAIRTLGSAFLSMAQEEVAQAMSRLPGGKVEQAADADDLTKAAYAWLDGISADGELIAKFAPAAADPDAIAALKADNDRLEKLVEKAVEPLNALVEKVTALSTDLTKAKEEIAALKTQPAPMPALAPIQPGTTVVTKNGVDPVVDANVTPEQVAAYIEKAGPEAVARTLIKASQGAPMAVLPGLSA